MFVKKLHQIVTVPGYNYDSAAAVTVGQLDFIKNTETAEKTVVNMKQMRLQPWELATLIKDMSACYKL